MKILVTGGHISPALAVIEALPKDVSVVFVGRKHTFENDSSESFEYGEIRKRNIPFFDLKTGRLQRKFNHHGLTSFLKIPKGLLAARKILREEKPDVILSFGGYIGLPVVLAGATLRIPSVIHEQTRKVGLSNKIAGKVAKKICISWESSRKFFPKNKIVLTGNPLRREILDALQPKAAKGNLPVIFITGGSAGSHQVNMIIRENLENLLTQYKVIHQVGNAKEFRDFDELLKYKDSLPEEMKMRYTLLKFVRAKEAATYMSEANLVIGRSGINTISELLYLKKKSFLIPLMHGQRGEQMTNALFLKSVGLSEIYFKGMNVPDIVEKMITSDDYQLKKPFDTSLFTDAAVKIIKVIEDASKKT